MWRDDPIPDRLIRRLGREDKVPVISPREREVLMCFSVGLTASEAAVVLGVSLSTVQTHRGHAKAKLAAKNVAHAVAVAFRQGIIV